MGSRTPAAVASTALLVAAASHAWAQDWGMRRLEVSLTRKIPSVITLTGSTVRVRLDARSQGQVPPQAAEIFRTRLTTEVFKDSRIVEERNAPDAIIEATINELSWTTKPIQRANFDVVKKQNVTYYTKLISGQIRVSYRTLDGRDKRGLDAANLRFDVEQEFVPTGEPYRELFKKKPEPFKRLPSDNEVYNYLVDGVVAQVTKRLVSVEESVSVPLPKGRLEAASKLGAALRWGAMLESLERMDAFQAPRDEAFRQYAMAVANEALAYQETERARAEEFLAKAALGYKNAIQRHGGEDAFQTAQNRIAAYLAPAASEAGSADAGSRGSAAAAQSGLMRNLDVIKLAQEKFSDEFILDAIAGAPKADFDVSIDAIVELKRAGVSEAVIKAIRTRKADAGKKGSGSS